MDVLVIHPRNQRVQIRLHSRITCFGYYRTCCHLLDTFRVTSKSDKQSPRWLQQHIWFKRDIMPRLLLCWRRSHLRATGVPLCTNPCICYHPQIVFSFMVISLPEERSKSICITKWWCKQRPECLMSLQVPVQLSVALGQRDDLRHIVFRSVLRATPLI